MSIVLDMVKKYYKEIIIGALIIALGTTIYFYFKKDDTNLSVNNTKDVVAVKEEEIVTKIYIDIKGEVKKPGVYEVDDDSIVQDAITLAGGLTKNGTTKNLNLSKLVSNEMVVIVANKKTLNNALKVSQTICKCEESDITECIKNEEVSIVSPTEGETPVEESATKISINTGSKEELMTLSGIGESKANNIISYRETNGSFKSLEEIMNVTGIGESIFAQIKENITL